MTINERIVKWNDERQLIKTPEEIDMMKEISFFIEECIEMVTDLKSEEAREWAERIAKEIMAKSTGFNKEKILDGACDANVFGGGLIRKLGYNPDIAMDETLKEIESRVGSIQDGKFVKDKSPEAQANWYKADYSKAEI